jgi:starch synthase
LETVKKLGWSPDIVHCTDWMTALIPMYLKTTYKNDPVFKDTKSIFTVYNNKFEHKFEGDIIEKAKMMDISDENLANLRSADFEGFIKIGCQYADVVVKANEAANESLNLILNELPDKKIDAAIEDANVNETYFNLYTELVN